MSPPWMPFYPGDYLQDTRRLTTTQHGAYFLLILEYWIAGSLPDDDEQLARIVGMSITEWRKTRPIVQAFFHDGWQHGRIDEEIAKAKSKQNRRQEAGKRGGIAKANARANAKQNPSNALASSPQPQPDKSSEANASDAGASIDHRTRLFAEGLAKLSSITGKGPDACRSFVGKCLKAAGDDAVVVLGLIEEAERNRAVDPSGWIAARLKGTSNGTTGSKIIQAADDLRRKIASFDGPAREDIELRGGSSSTSARLLSNR